MIQILAYPSIPGFHYYWVSQNARWTFHGIVDDSKCNIAVYVNRLWKLLDVYSFTYYSHIARSNQSWLVSGSKSSFFML